ncbi:MAG: hypothetical protein HYX68_09410 [Planctomycetes bacterium]|nr:hypothetical protein [Planctomycetota bacterium]
METIQTVTGPILAIKMPPAFQGKQVKIVVTPMESTTDEDEFAKRRREGIMEKPALSPELRQRLLDNPDLLKTEGYDDPFGPACPPEDWEAVS